MSDFADEELLSAYLDGELTAAEQARVERLLAEQPESRQLLEELCWLKTSLERMPRDRLGHDFAERVLRRAEKQLLTGGELEDGEPLKQQRSQPMAARRIEPAKKADRFSGLSWQRMRRPVIWSSLTLAAGLLIMFLDREVIEPRPQQVARAPGNAGKRGRGEIGAPAGAPTSAQNEPRPVVPAGEAENNRAYFRRSEPSASSPAAGEAVTMPAPADAPLTMPDERKTGLRRRSAGTTAGAAKPAPADKLADESVKDVAREALGLSEVMKRDSDLDAVQELSADADQTLVVWCDVAPGAAYDKSFRELLAKQNIQWDEEAESSEVDAYRDRSLQSRIDRTKAQKNAPARGQRAASDPNAEVVLVEASEPQIEAVLAALDEDAKVFVNVDVEPAPDSPRQQQLERFGRRLSESEKLGEQTADAKAKQEFKNSAKAAAVPRALAPQSDPGLATQTGPPQGTARKLTLRAAASPEGVAQLDKSSVSPTDATRQAAKSPALQLAKEAQVKLRQSGPQGNKAENAGRDLAGAAGEQGRYQVLFVLHPLETQKPAAQEAPADEDDQ